MKEKLKDNKLIIILVVILILLLVSVGSYFVYNFIIDLF